MRQKTLSPEQYHIALTKLPLKSASTITDTRGDSFYHCWQHADNTPSLSISFKKGIYHCFSCGASGTINELCKELVGKSIYKLLNIEQVDFATFLLSAPPIIERTPIEEPTVIVPSVAIDIRGVCISYKDSEEAKAYCAKRSIAFSVADAMKMQYTTEAFINGNFFKKRLLIPIYDENRKLLNIEGRDVTFKQEKKCIYPSGSVKPIFEYYSLDTKEPLYLVEGLIKLAVLRSDSYFSNSSCSFGANISGYQFSLLNKFKAGIICIPDNDTAGEIMVKSLKQSCTVPVSVLRIKDAFIKDVDEIPAKTSKNVKEYRESGGFVRKYSIEFKR